MQPKAEKRESLTPEIKTVGEDCFAPKTETVDPIEDIHSALPMIGEFQLVDNKPDPMEDIGSTIVTNIPPPENGQSMESHKNTSMRASEAPPTFLTFPR